MKRSTKQRYDDMERIGFECGMYGKINYYLRDRRETFNFFKYVLPISASILMSGYCLFSASDSKKIIAPVAAGLIYASNKISRKREDNFLDEEEKALERMIKKQGCGIEELEIAANNEFES